MGKSHLICEDYTLAGDGYVIVSDGCSSAEHSDIGARLLAHAASHILTNFNKEVINDYHAFGDAIIKAAAAQQAVMNISKSAIDATLIVAQVIDKTITVSFYGDGLAYIKYIDGTSEITEIVFPKERPLYLSYRLSKNRRSRYLDSLLGLKMVTKETLLDSSNNTVNICSVKTEVSEGASVIKVFDLDTVDTLIIATDGISTFQEFFGKKIIRDIPIAEIVPQISDFKVRTSGLCQRKLNRLSQTNLEKSIFHYDDLGVGVIICQ